MGTFLTLVSLCELGITLAYLSTAHFPQPWVCYSLISALCSEALLYYVFTGYIALRRVDTIAELIRMLFSIPVYYALVLVCALSRTDLSKARLLSQLIYFEFPQEVLVVQMAVHVTMCGVPCSVLLVLSVWITDPMGPLGICTLCVLCVSTSWQLMLLLWKLCIREWLRGYSRRIRLLN